MNASDLPLGAYLRELRTVAGLTLRGVEERTEGAVKNGYLSQIEIGHIKKPSPEVLWNLARVYSVDYNELLERAGHRTISADTAPAATIAGIPLSAIADLDEEDQKDLLEYVDFLRSRKRRRT